MDEEITENIVLKQINRYLFRWNDDQIEYLSKVTIMEKEICKWV